MGRSSAGHGSGRGCRLPGRGYSKTGIGTEFPANSAMGISGGSDTLGIALKASSLPEKLANID